MGKTIDLSMLSKLNNGRTDILNGFAMIYDDIDNEVAKAITQWIIESNFGDETQPDVLNLMINSQGGSLTDALAIIDVMHSSAIPIRTIGLGQIASAALMIFMSGEKGQRILTPNTSIMSHRFSAGAIGKSHELFAVAKEYKLTEDRIIDLYKKCSGLKEDKIRKILLPPEDVFLTAKEALQYGICDKIALLK